ncbi:hypothetical protein BGX24_004389 [Mortierella sp. AD032]|nr:hypothetical protein BGX24_004389 [Mortierella sp. AD032]
MEHGFLAQQEKDEFYEAQAEEADLANQAQEEFYVDQTGQGFYAEQSDDEEFAIDNWELTSELESIGENLNQDVADKEDDGDLGRDVDKDTSDDDVIWRRIPGFLLRNILLLKTMSTIEHDDEGGCEGADMADNDDVTIKDADDDDRDDDDDQD